jgi:hypothetical protein
MLGPLKVEGMDSLTCVVRCKSDTVYVYHFLCAFLVLILNLTQAISGNNFG